MTSLASSVIGRRIHQERQRRGVALSQVERATGITATRLRMIEEGHEMPRGSELFDIAAFHGIKPDQIIRGLTVEMATQNGVASDRERGRGASAWQLLPSWLRRLFERLAAALNWV